MSLWLAGYLSDIIVLWLVCLLTDVTVVGWLPD